MQDHRTERQERERYEQPIRPVQLALRRAAFALTSEFIRLKHHGSNSRGGSRGAK